MCGPCPVFGSYTLEFFLQLRKKYGKTSVRVVLRVGLELTQCVSEQYCYRTLTGLAMPDTCKNTPITLSIHSRQQSWQAICLGKLMKFNSCFNFKLSKCNGVFG